MFLIKDSKVIEPCRLEIWIFVSWTFLIESSTRPCVLESIERKIILLCCLDFQLIISEMLYRSPSWQLYARCHISNFCACTTPLVFIQNFPANFPDFSAKRKIFQQVHRNTQENSKVHPILSDVLYVGPRPTLS